MICLNVCVFVCFKGGKTRAVQDDRWLRVSGVGVDRR
jgi:hypothetical protein